MRHLSLSAFLIILMPCLLQAQVGDGRIYVKRIVFVGTDRIDDKVLRRELSQREGTHINTVELEQSRLRRERLPYVGRAQVIPRPVKDAPDQVDVLITISEAPARRYGGGSGYSESHRASVHSYFINENLFGTGQRFFAQVEASEFHTAAQLSHTDPYVRRNGISRTIALSWRRFDQLTADTTELEGDLVRARLEYGYQVAGRQAIRLGLALQDAQLTAGPLASSQLLDWVRNNGSTTVQGNESSTDYLTAEFLLGWRHDTRDKREFPNTGVEQLLSLKIAVPGSAVEYYAIDYELSKYWPLNGGWTAKI